MNDRRDEERKHGGNGGREWRKVAAVVTGSVVASVLIAFGAARYLDQAQCLRDAVQAQARGNALMGQVVLDPSRTQDDRRAAFTAWADEQGRLADRIGGC